MNMHISVFVVARDIGGTVISVIQSRLVKRILSDVQLLEGATAKAHLPAAFGRMESRGEAGFEK
jgi:hypothetical protein